MFNTCYFGIPNGNSYDWWHFTDDSISDLVLGCRSNDELAIMFNNQDGLVSRVFDMSAETLSSAEEIYSSGGADITGAGSRFGGEPFVLYHHEDSAVRRAWSDDDDWSGSSRLSSLQWDGYTEFGGAAYSENDLGHLAYIYSDEVFYYAEDDFQTGQYTYWEDDSQEWTFADVTVDREDRVWIVYGHPYEFNIWMRCPE